MSTYRSYSYSLERERRRELASQRVRDSTRPYVQTYYRVLGDVLTSSAGQYVAKEHAELAGEISRLEGLLASDPFEARDLSRSIASRAFGLRRLAEERRRARIEAERAAEQLRVEQLTRARAELELVWQQELSSWEDPNERDAALNALVDIRARLMSADATTTPDKLRSAIRTIRDRQKVISREQQEAIRREAEADALASELQACREQLTQVVSARPGCAVPLTAILEGAENLPPRELSERLARFTQELDGIEVDEAFRREVLQKVSRALQDAGFVVQTPRWSDDKHEVVVRANRPAGAQAEFRVALNGGLRFKFDRYKGSACKADVEKVLPRLQAVYGINLSDERVLWENPDDRDADARPMPPLTGEVK